jgi:hypothetical protein
LLSWINVTEAKVVVLNRGEFVNILAGVDNVQQGLENLKHQLDACDTIIQEQNTLKDKLKQQISKQDEIIKSHEKIKEVQLEVIERQEAKIKSMEFWDKFKNIGLMLLIGAAVAGVVAIH